MGFLKNEQKYQDIIQYLKDYQNINTLLQDKSAFKIEDLIHYIDNQDTFFQEPNTNPSLIYYIIPQCQKVLKIENLSIDNKLNFTFNVQLRKTHLIENIHKDFSQYQKYGVNDDDLQKNNSKESSWIVLNGKVFDVTQYAQKHPGGDIIYKYLGNKGTEAFQKYHPWINYEYLLKDYYVGEYKGKQLNYNDLILLLQLLNSC